MEGDGRCPPPPARRSNRSMAPHPAIATAELPAPRPAAPAHPQPLAPSPKARIAAGRGCAPPRFANMPRVTAGGAVSAPRRTAPSASRSRRGPRGVDDRRTPHRATDRVSTGSCTDPPGQRTRRRTHQTGPWKARKIASNNGLRDRSRLGVAFTLGHANPRVRAQGPDAPAGPVEAGPGPLRTAARHPRQNAHSCGVTSSDTPPYRQRRVHQHSVTNAPHSSASPEPGDHDGRTDGAAPATHPCLRSLPGSMGGGVATHRRRYPTRNRPP